MTTSDVALHGNFPDCPETQSLSVIQTWTESPTSLLIMLKFIVFQVYPYTKPTSWWKVMNMDQLPQIQHPNQGKSSYQLALTTGVMLALLFVHVQTNFFSIAGSSSHIAVSAWHRSIQTTAYLPCRVS
jgi:nitric oxide reductase large subunit